MIRAGLAVLVLAAGTASFATAQTPPVSKPATPTGSPMTATATGPFEVKMTPQPGVTEAVGRFGLDKTYHGDLEATAAGEMIAVRTAEKGSAGYVALETVTGTLAGRSGSFALQHFGLMDKGTPDLKIVVVPDSGTGGLAGLTGTMTIDVQAGGKHVYTFTYTLPASAAPAAK